MSLKPIFAFVVLSVVSSSAFSQDVFREQRDTQIPFERQTQSQGLARLKSISERSKARQSRTDDLQKRLKPNLSQTDIDAISPHPEDLKQFQAFLKQPRTGIVRLQDADVCAPEKDVVQVENGCPNNVSGKATGFSFRTGDYKPVVFTDVFLHKNELGAAGKFTVGIFSNLGQIELKDLTKNSNGIRQLWDFEPSGKKDDVAHYLKMLSKGIRIGDHIYKTKLPVKVNDTYIVRSVAYKGRLLKEVRSGFKVNLLENDERADVLVVFRVVRKHDDGSVTLLWKELQRKESPRLTDSK